MSIYHEGFAIPKEDEIPFLQRIFRGPLGIVLLTAFFLISFSYVGTHLGPLLLLIVLRINPLWYRRFVDWGIGLFLTLTMFGIETMFGIRPKRFGHKMKFDNRCVLLMNHRCHLDWFFLWTIIARQGDLSVWKPMMKMSLKKLPLLGWLVQFPMHIFLKRSWEDDEEEVSTKLHFFNALNTPLQLLLFPEGADLTAKSKAKSDAFAESENLPKYDYVLHPRTKGFIYSVATLKKAGLDSIIDITIAYPDVLPKTEIEFLKGKIPREIHFYIERFPLKDVPESEEGLALWCQERWKVKEKRLKFFYENRRFPGSCDTGNFSNMSVYELSNFAAVEGFNVGNGDNRHLGIGNGNSGHVANGNGIKSHVANSVPDELNHERASLISHHQPGGPTNLSQIYPSNGTHTGNGSPPQHIPKRDDGHPGSYPILSTRNGLLFALLLFLAVVGTGVYMTIFHFSFYLMTGIPGLLYMIYHGNICRGIDYNELALHTEAIRKAQCH